jgi:hypothetical protein
MISPSKDFNVSESRDRDHTVHFCYLLVKSKKKMSMNREIHVRVCEDAGVRFPRVTQVLK